MPYYEPTSASWKFAIMTTPNCYAHHLGGCDKISAEHIVSQCIFKRPHVQTSGLPIPENLPVGIGSLTAKILCSKHNSDLSDLDAEICKLSDELYKISIGSRCTSISVSGIKLERWLLKVVAGSLSSGWIAGVKVPPPTGVVRALFGLSPLPPSVGLYGIANVERWLSPQHVFGFDYFLGRQEGTIGFVLSIYGLPLFFSMGLEEPEMELRAQGTKCGINVATASVQLHPQSIVVSGQESPYLTLRFDWP